jgi:hypothetical protein
MQPVEPTPPPGGNPGASRSVCQPLRCRRRHARHDAGASVVRAGHGTRARAETAGSAGRLGVAPRRGPGPGKDGHSSGCPGRSGCTGRPARGSARTGTGGRVGPCAPRHHRSAGRTRPSEPHCCGTAFIGTVSGAVRSSSLPAVRPLPRPPSSASIALYRVMPSQPPDSTDSVRAGITIATPSPRPAPAWPPCRAARPARTPLRTRTIRQPQPGRNYRQTKPPPHRRIVSDPDRRSHGSTVTGNRYPDGTVRYRLPLAPPGIGSCGSAVGVRAVGG